MGFEQSLADAKATLGITYELKQQQIEALKALYKRKDVVCLLPTAFGKSVIYQLTPFLLAPPNGITLVVAPLNAIMHDQVLKLCKAGIKACCLDMAGKEADTFMLCSPDHDADDTDADEYMRTSVTLAELQTGKFNIVYTHPEALLSTSPGRQLMRSSVYQEQVCCIAIDEVHMVHEWGEDFRPSFSRLQDLLGRFPDVPALLLTATASSNTKNKLVEDLGLRDPECITVHPDRSNIKYYKYQRLPSGKQEDDLDRILGELVEELRAKRTEMPLTIIYTDTEIIRYAYRFVEDALGAEQYEGEVYPDNRLFGQYHSHYPTPMKEQIVKQLGTGSPTIRLIFSTIALGMGLDAPSVRRIIHFKAPTTIARYLQETGRAGRDGLPATAILYYNNTDLMKQRKVDPTMKKFCKSVGQCLRDQLMDHLGYSAPSNRRLCACCQVCELLCECDTCIESLSQ